MMASGSTPNVFNSVDFSEIELCPRLFRRLRAEYSDLSRRLQSAEGLRAFQSDRDLLDKTTVLLDYLVKTIGPHNTAIVAMDAPIIAYLMQSCDVWYDYTCMPQEPRSKDEQIKFNRELDLLHHYFSKYYTSILWSKKSLKRAWCFLEAAVSLRAGQHSIFSTENSLLSSDTPAKIYEKSFGETVFGPSDQPIEVRKESETSFRLYRRNQERVDLSSDLTAVLADAVHSATYALKGKDDRQILTYFEENGYSCTNEEDLQIVAKSLAAHLT
jgi:hypothetical protein